MIWHLSIHANVWLDEQRPKNATIIYSSPKTNNHFNNNKCFHGITLVKERALGKVKIVFIE